ncbi:MAG: hypothetical protein ACTTGJ_02755 [Clostridium sp.]
MKSFVLNILNQDYISNIYIGITGIVVAIVIFIAEAVKEQDNELNKRVLLHYSKLKRNITIMLVIFVYMLISNSLKYNENIELKSFNNICYLIIHTILFMSTIYAIVITGKMFFIALKLNTEKNYMNKKIVDYVYNRTKVLEKNEVNKIVKRENEKLKTFIDSQTIFFSIKQNEKLDEKYIPIYSPKIGFIKSYNYEKFTEMVNMYEEEKQNEENYVSENKIIAICNKIGIKINKNEPIFYCLAQYKKIFENISEAIIYEEQRFFINDEIKLINNSLFERSFKYNQLDDFDENYMIYNYFDFLYKNNLLGVKQLAIQSIEEYYRKVYDDYIRNKQFCIFLNRLAYLMRTNDDFINYENIIIYEYYLYIHQLEMKNVDTKEVTYNFANDILRYNLFSAKNNEDNRYYECLMTILFKFLVNLLKNEKYEEINVLLNNILIKEIDLEKREFNQQDIIKFQFSIGIIISLIILANRDKLLKKDENILKKVINYFVKNLVNSYSVWEVICNFKKYYRKATAMQKAYDNLDLYFVDHKYKNSWSTICIDERLILKEYIYLNDISFIDEQSINFTQIDKEDKWFYCQLRNLIKDKKQTKIEAFFEVNYNSEKLESCLDIIIKNAEDKEKEFNRTNELDDRKLNEFKEKIFKEFNKDTEFTEFLRKNDKIKIETKILKKVYGINQLLPRELFFSNKEISDFLVTDFKHIFDMGLTTEYINRIEKISTLEKKSFNEVIKAIKNIEEYVIITNYINYKTLEKYKYDYKNNTILINNNKIAVIRISKVNGIFLIKKKDLPYVSIFKFDTNEWNEQNIVDNIYYELIDCSKDENLRKEIISHSKWLNKKGNEEEQDNYLKECCRLRIYKAYRILNKHDSMAIKIKNDD